MTTIYRDKIEAFHGSWSSGLATLEFQSGKQVFCESGPTGRALDAAFNCASGHCILNDKIRGQDIIYLQDDLMGILEGFGLYEEWEGEEIPLGGSIELDD